MPMLKNVLGLDLGSHSIKAVEFEQSLRGADALQLRGVERDVDDADLPDLLRRFIEQYRLPNEHVVAADIKIGSRLAFDFYNSITGLESGIIGRGIIE